MKKELEKKKPRTGLKRTKKGSLIEVFAHPLFPTLYIAASKEDWDRLKISLLRDSHFFYDNFCRFAQDLYSPFRVRDKREVRYWFSRLMKIQAGILNICFSHWLKKPTEHIQLIEKGINKNHKRLLIKKGKPIPLAYTAYCMQIVYGRFLETYKLKPFLDLENGTTLDSKVFRNGYVIDGKNLLKGLKKDYQNIQGDIYDLIVIRTNWIKESECSDIFTLVYLINETILANHVPFYCNGMGEEERKTISVFSNSLPDELLPLPKSKSLKK